MSKAIGMVEYRTVSTGVQAADIMLKTSSVDILESSVVCPGKYITGDLSAVKAAVDASKTRFDAELIDSFVLGNPDEAIFSAIYGATEVKDVKALGILETFSAASIIVAADAAAKTSQVELIELRLARGMCGKSYLMLTGEVAAVSAAIDKAKASVADNGMFLESSVIANPDKRLWDTIL